MTIIMMTSMIIKLILSVHWSLDTLMIFVMVGIGNFSPSSKSFSLLLIRLAKTD